MKHLVHQKHIISMKNIHVISDKFGKREIILDEKKCLFSWWQNCIGMETNRDTTLLNESVKWILVNLFICCHSRNQRRFVISTKANKWFSLYDRKWPFYFCRNVISFVLWQVSHKKDIDTGMYCLERYMNVLTPRLFGNHIQHQSKDSGF